MGGSPEKGPGLPGQKVFQEAVDKPNLERWKRVSLAGEKGVPVGVLEGSGGGAAGEPLPALCSCAQPHSFSLQPRWEVEGLVPS